MKPGLYRVQIQIEIPQKQRNSRSHLNFISFDMHYVVALFVCNKKRIE